MNETKEILEREKKQLTAKDTKPPQKDGKM